LLISYFIVSNVTITKEEKMKRCMTCHTVHNVLPKGDKCDKEKACPRCFKLGHKLEECTAKLPSDVVCVNCGKKGHLENDCTFKFEAFTLCPACGEKHTLFECKQRNLKVFCCSRCGSFEHSQKDCTQEEVHCCSYCGKNHLSKDCENKPQPAPKVLHCAICHATDHATKDCPKDKVDVEEKEKQAEEATPEPAKKEEKKNMKIDVANEQEFPALA